MRALALGHRNLYWLLVLPALFMMLAFYTYPLTQVLWISSWDEIVVLLFITSRKLFLLPRAIWAGINENVDPTIAAVATLLMLATLTGLAVERVLRWRAARGGRLAVVLPPREAPRAEPVPAAE